MWVYVAVFVSVISALLWRSWWDYCVTADKIPGPPALPLVGNVMSLSTDLEKLFSMLASLHPTYGRLVRFWGGPKLCVFMTDPVDVQAILGSTKFINKDYHFHLPIYKVMGNGLLANRDNIWKTHRKFITPAFSFKILKGYLDIFGRTSKVLLKCLEEVADGRAMDPTRYILQTTMESIRESAFGSKIQYEEETDMVEVLRAGGQVMMKCTVKPWILADWVLPHTAEGKIFTQLRKDIDQRTSLHINEKLKEFQDDYKYEEDSMRPFVDILIEESSKEGSLMTLVELQEELNHIAVAAIDTSAITLSTLLTLLAIYPDIQQQVIDEMEAIFGDDTRQPTFDDIGKMDVLSRCLKEALRLFPSAPFLDREITEDITVSRGYVIPKGATVIVFAYSVHRDPENYPEPDRFWPDRWLPENSVGRHPYSFVPFGGGPRNCIGQKYAYLLMKTIASSILRRFSVTTTRTLKSMERLEAGPIIRPVEGFSVQMHKLQK